MRERGEAQSATEALQSENESLKRKLGNLACRRVEETSERNQENKGASSLAANVEQSCSQREDPKHLMLMDSCCRHLDGKRLGDKVTVKTVSSGKIEELEHVIKQYDRAQFEEATVLAGIFNIRRGESVSSTMDRFKALVNTIFVKNPSIKRVNICQNPPCFRPRKDYSYIQELNSRLAGWCANNDRLNYVANNIGPNPDFISHDGTLLTHWGTARLALSILGRDRAILHNWQVYQSHQWPSEARG